MVCLCAALVSLSFQGGAKVPSPVVQPTIPPLSPSKMVNIAGRGKLGATPTRPDMVSRREHNQHVATRGRSPPALVNRGPGNTSVRAPPLFSIAVSRGYMWKRANTCMVCARTAHVVDACEGQTQPPSSSSPFEYARFLLNSAPGSKARACSFRPCKILTLVLGPLIQRSASYLDCPPLRQRPDVG